MTIHVAIIGLDFRVEFIPVYQRHSDLKISANTTFVDILAHESGL